MEAPEYSRVPGDGLEIQVARWPGQGGNVLCIHGLTANCRCWDRIAQAIIPEQQVLAPDLRGRGFSDKPESGYSLEHHCRDIEALAAHLGLDRIIVMGHSLGAAITAYLAATRPNLVEKAVLVDGGGQLSKEQMEKVVAGIRLSLERLGKVFPDFETYVQTLQKAPFFESWSPYLDAYFQYETEAVAGGVRSRVYPEGIQEELANMRAVRIGDYYGRITCPVLILRATEGMMSPDDLLLPEDVAARMEQEIATARRIDIPGTNHYSLLFEASKTRDDALREFIVS